MTTKGCKWLGTISNSEAADGLASRYAKPSAPTRPPNIHNLQNTWPTTARQPKVANGLAPYQTQEPQIALHQDMPSHLHLPGRQKFTTPKLPGPLQHDNQRLQMAWHHIKLRSCRWPCNKICQAICTYRAAKHLQPPNHLDMPEQTKHFILETNWKERFKYSHHRYLLKNNTYYFNRINTFQYPGI